MSRIAVVGAGVAGLYAAWHLAADHGHEVTLIEAGDRPGGHADSHRVQAEGMPEPVDVDTGFIVFNHRHYPHFSAWLERLGVASHASDMSFGVCCEPSGLEYNATSLDTLFCQRRNLASPRFLGMVAGILRFYRRAPRLLDTLDESVTLGEWLDGPDSPGQAFADDHLVPMASALWSSPSSRVRQFPMRYLLEFMRNHDMLQVDGRPQWRTVTGGSQRYVEAALRSFGGRLRVATPVRAVERLEGKGVRVVLDDGPIEVDHVILACHADQALALLGGSATGTERDVLQHFDYEDNDTVLHTDASRMPRQAKAWAAWTVRRDAGGDPDRAAISYWMNRLQGLPDDVPLIVSLNQTERIDPDRILIRRAYRHPVYTPAMRRAQARIEEIDGVDRVSFAGAGWGWGFHEDAVRSAVRAIAGLPSSVRDVAA
ncbi:FAD-dependent oxidoreductase [Wenzhouxiangella sp. XN79A]|uniref:NAD(P)/FAD-dependent oxidoreductase n=1 Tax=Wenzhouxiangella sp. XN79A TaxID=2724193 RepID=UPI00144AF0F1|nr:FAD-dependent oxidoreductase [Wenzhouxiangella sp. XN79A]NKI34432.1 FAD-dependent oxidoreductase [Wenzhouxiangella sp. XN79A]